MRNIDDILYDKPTTHVVDLLIDYFLNCNLDGTKFTYETWKTISNDLLNKIKIKPDVIKNIKNNYKDEYFLNSYDEFLNYNFDSYFSSGDIKPFIHLNASYEKVLVNSIKCEFYTFYPKIFTNLWINNKIIFENDNLGIIIYNIVEKYEHIYKHLKLYNKIQTLIDFMGYIYGMYHSGKFLIKQHDFIKINDVEHYNLVQAYALYMFINIRNYLNDYYIYGNTDKFFYVASNRQHLDINNLSDYIVKTYGANFYHHYELNINCLFINKKSYLYTNERGRLTYVGIDNITGQDDDKIKKLSRISKINSLLL